MSNSYLKVKDVQGLVRDKDSNAILNSDAIALNKYREEREQKRRIVSMLDEHETLKNDVSEIKEMLKTLLGKR
jgi:hypothetical protein